MNSFKLFRSAGGNRGEAPRAKAIYGAGAANDAARPLQGPARHAAHAAGQAAAVAHVAAHYLGAAAYAIKAVRPAVPKERADEAGREECRWQRGRLPEEIRALVPDDHKVRNGLCWNVFEV